MVPPYQDKGHALEGEKVAAQARRIVNRHQIIEKAEGETTILQGCALRESAYCVIERPLRKNSIPPSILDTN